MGDLESVPKSLSCTAKTGLMLVQITTWSGGSTAGVMLDVLAVITQCPFAKAQARP